MFLWRHAFLTFFLREKWFIRKNVELCSICLRLFFFEVYLCCRYFHKYFFFCACSCTSFWCRPNVPSLAQILFGTLKRVRGSIREIMWVGFRNVRKILDIAVFVVKLTVFTCTCILSTSCVGIFFFFLRIKVILRKLEQVQGQPCLHLKCGGCGMACIVLQQVLELV